MTTPGLCRCGCGQHTANARKTDRSKGHVKGQPFFYVAGHGSTPPMPPIKRAPIVPIGPSIAYIPLTQGQFALIEIEDLPEISRWNWCAVWIENTHSFGARRARRRGRAGRIPAASMHQVVLPLPKGLIPDHANSNTLDNRRHGNLRPANNQQNLFNSRLRVDSRSGFKGTTYRKRIGKYESSIRINGKKKHLGVHNTPEASNEAYFVAAQETVGEFARRA